MTTYDQAAQAIVAMTHGEAIAKVRDELASGWVCMSSREGYVTLLNRLVTQYGLPPHEAFDLLAAAYEAAAYEAAACDLR
jgi:hypothetical protein